MAEKEPTLGTAIQTIINGVAAKLQQDDKMAGASASLLSSKYREELQDTGAARSASAGRKRQ